MSAPACDRCRTTHDRDRLTDGRCFDVYACERRCEAATSAPESTRGVLPPEVARVLRKTDPRRWHHYALLIDAETGERLMLRAELVAWLRSSDLPELAHEAHRRAVPSGAILVLTLNAEHGPTFRVLCDPRRATR